MSGSQAPPRNRRSVFALPLAVWAIMLALMAVSVAIAFLPLGPGKLFANLAISGAQAALVAAILMRLDRASALVRLAAAAAFVWIAMLFTLSGADYFSRP